MIKVKLREAMERYRADTGRPLTYRDLAQRTGLAETTLQSLGSRAQYNTTLATIEALCIALNCSPGDLLEQVREAADQ